ncbi:MAG: hypothetical protein SOX14_06155 [Ruminococcus callidus]|nr:hypothetical protein [Ruminococcus callidus]
MKITNKEDFAIISNRPELKSYLENKAKIMSEEYNVDYFEAIGCFVILDNEEDFPSEEELEFSETVTIGGNNYLHCVRIISDSYGEDIWLLK